MQPCERGADLAQLARPTDCTTTSEEDQYLECSAPSAFIGLMRPVRKVRWSGARWA